MNSMEEKELFELYGWTYDLIGRKWIAPDGYELELDTLVAAMENFGAAAEEALPDLVRQHGERR